jgi:urea carboxylase system permease
VTHTNGVQGHGSYIGPFLASMLMAAYVFYGFDSAAELSEETRDPRATAPRAITRCMMVSAVGGGLLILATLMAAPSLTNGDLATDGLAYVITSQLGNTLGKILLIIVAISIFSATLAISASAARVMFSMSRDGRLPFARQLSYVSKRSKCPVLPGVMVSVLSIGVLLLNLGNTEVFAAVSSVAVVIVYLAYLMVTVPLLIKRLRGHYQPTTDATWTLGRFGLPVNIVAVIGGAFLMVNIGWPRVEVYDPGTPHWYLQYASPLFVVVAVSLGAIAYPLMKRQQSSSSGVIAPSDGAMGAPMA